MDYPTSAAEEQPQQNDHRYRHAQQPEQNSTSHVHLLEFLNRRENIKEKLEFLSPEQKTFCA
jgi:hypothetical protein